MTGIALGLGVAVVQSVAFLYSRHILRHGHRTPSALFAVSHLLMAAAAAAALLTMPSAVRPPLSTLVVPLLVCEGAYVMGQLMMFASVKRVESSIVVPFLGMKVLIVATLSILLLGRAVPGPFWVAVMLCAVSVVVLNPVSPRRLRAALGSAQTAVVPPPAGVPGNCPHARERHLAAALALIFGASTLYAFSDIGIAWLNEALEPMGRWGPLYGMAWCYMLGGVPALAMTIHFRRGIDRALWVESIPYAFLWTAAVALLFLCISFVGPVMANILQSTRGIVIVILGFAVARAGWENVERRAPRSVWARRLAGATLLLVAVALAIGETLRSAAP